MGSTTRPMMTFATICTVLALRGVACRDILLQLHYISNKIDVKFDHFLFNLECFQNLYDFFFFLI